MKSLMQWGVIGVAFVAWLSGVGVLVRLEATWQISLVMASHLVAIGMLHLAGRFQARGPVRRALTQTLPIALFLPLVGPLLVLTAWEAARRPALRSFLEEYEEYIGYDPRHDQMLPNQEQRIEEQQVLGGTRSYRDLIQGDGSVEQKIVAIQELSRQPNPEAVQLLQYAAKDSSSEVGYVAAVALTEMERKLQEQVVAAQALTREHPEGVGGWHEYGLLCLDYARSGLLGGPNRAYYLERSEIALRRAMDLHPQGLSVATGLVEVMTLQDRQDEALAEVSKYLERSPHDRFLLQLEAQILFDLRRCGTLRKRIAEHRERFPEEIVEAWV